MMATLRGRMEEQARARRESFPLFATPEKVQAHVERMGRYADERLPELYQRRDVQRANVETLRVVGGDPFRKAQDLLWEISSQIEHDEPWQQLRDCLAAGIVQIEITSMFVHFSSRYPNRRLCRIGPHNHCPEFTQGGKRQLATLAGTARSMRKA